ncbi:hypothetical protein [Streptomyces yaizuensis]|uniref:Uncharacterized protein n=1 Tax=Streptomyces yaizuensis TaxID=2989713 RepID=A0ABQ5NXU6_9ACTN|nr:hypothetical protein [Streptomyces sp. YSPA8]GLF95204.1 hypothetical protein SYYSPA8_12925 [Streptomyces sp. YSPA8]
MHPSWSGLLLCRPGDLTPTGGLPPGGRHAPLDPFLSEELLHHARAARHQRAQDWTGPRELAGGPLVEWEALRLLWWVVDKRGWPGHRLAGAHGAAAAMEIALACDLPDHLQLLLRVLKKAADLGDAPRCHPALLHDRLCALARVPQRYGSQDTLLPGGWHMAEVDQPESLTLRRGQKGLPGPAPHWIPARGAS